MSPVKRTTPILAVVALAACHSVECGIGTHEKDGLCVTEGPATVFDPTTHTVTNVHTNVHTNDHTVVVTTPVTNTVVVTTPVDTDPVLAPGQFESPLIQLKKVLDTKGAVGAAGSGQSHMHVSEVRYRAGDGLAQPAEMAYCSYTFGVVNVTDPENASYMAQGWTWPATDPNTTDTFKPRAPGCQHFIFDDDDPDIVYTAQHGDIDDGPGFLSAVDLNHTLVAPATVDTLAPVLGPQLMEASAAYEGVDFENGHLFAALHDGGLGVYHRDLLGPDGIIGPVLQGDGVTLLNDDNTIVPDAVYTTDLTNVWDVKVDGNLAYVCDGLNGLVVLDVSDLQNPITLGHVVTGGNARDIVLNEFGTIAYLATETNGTVVVDVTDPTNPVVLSTTRAPSAIEAVSESNGYVAVAAWDDTRVYDVADPENPVFVAGTRLAVPKVYTGDDGSRPDITGRTLAVDLHDDVLYMGDWWTPYTYRFKPENRAPYEFLPEDVNLKAFPGDLALGESSQATLEVHNDGNEDLTLYNNWVDNPAFTVTPWQVRIPPGESTTLTLQFTASIAATVDTADTAAKPTPVEEHGFLHIQTDDPTQPERIAYLVGNMTALSVGDKFPEDMAGTLVDGNEWSYTANASGNVLLFAYFATY